MFLYETESKKALLDIIILAGGSLAAYIKELNWELFFVWSILLGIDIISGVLVSLKKKNHSSKAFKNGLYNKVGEMLLITAIVFMQRLLLLSGIKVPCFEILLISFCLKELSSIMENSIKLNVKIPEVVKNWFSLANESLKTKKQKNK